MNNLHLLIIGSSEEEIRANAAKALDDAFEMYKRSGNQANCLAPDEYEFEFRPEPTMADINDSNNISDEKLED